MKHTILIALLFISFQIKASDWIGYWEGTLPNDGQSIKFGFHFEPGPSGILVNIDVPQQSVLHYKASVTVVKEDSCTISFDAFKSFYKGKIKGDTIYGLWEQNGASIPLLLHRSALAILQRPQTPHAPFPYVSTDLVFPSTDGSMEYGATFTKPSETGAFPTIILITGSGQQDRDETIADHKPFFVLSDYLTRHGYAVLRIDDRGKGETTGKFQTSTTFDFAFDVRQAISFLKKRKDVISSQIGLLGHSEGGLIAPIVASASKDVAFIIMLAGPGLKGDKLLKEQYKALLMVRGAEEKEATAYSNLLYDWILISEKEQDSVKAFALGMQAYAKWLSIYGNQMSEKLFNTADTAVMTTIFLSEYKKNRSPWLSAFLQTDPFNYLKKVHCPVLALNGSMDAQVVPELNTARIKSALKQANNTRGEVDIVPGLNHLFQHCDSYSQSTSYGLIEETMSPQVLTIISSWLDTVLHKSK